MNDHAQMLHEEGLSRLRDLVDGTLEFTRDFSRDRGPDPIPGSIAAGELALAPFHGATNSPQGLLHDAYEIASSILLPSASFVLQGLGQLYVPPVVPFAFQILTRSVLEYAASAWWLMDSSISAEMRASRYLAWVINNSNEMAGLGLFSIPELEATTPSNGLRIYHSRQAARARDSGLLVEFANPKRTKQLFGVNAHHDSARAVKSIGGQELPPATRLIDEFLKTLQQAGGAAWFKYLASITHGKSFSLLHSTRVVLNDDGETARREGVIQPQTLVDTTGVALTSYLGAVQAHSSLFGYETDRVDLQLRDLISALGVLSPSP
jgi:hypothetical protein